MRAYVFFFIHTYTYIQTYTHIHIYLAVCFPQFGPRGQLPQHGFVRKSNDWTATEPQEGDKRMVFKHSDTEETRASAWPHKFEATYEVELGSETLTTCLRVKNTGDQPFEFTCALHTYFRVSDVSKIAIQGLKVCAAVCMFVYVSDVCRIVIKGLKALCVYIYLYTYIYTHAYIHSYIHICTVCM